MSELVPRSRPCLITSPRRANKRSGSINTSMNGRARSLRYGQILYKRRKLVLAITLAMFAVGVVWTMTRPRLYSASVNIQIESETSVLPYKEMAALIPLIRHTSALKSRCSKANRWPGESSRD